MPTDIDTTAPDYTDVSDPASQDVDPAISPAPPEEPKATSNRDKSRLIAKSLNKGIFVTIGRQGVTNGRTHTGKLALVEPAEDGTPRYAVRTGQAGRPVVVTEADIRTIYATEVPVKSDSDDDDQPVAQATGS